MISILLQLYQKIYTQFIIYKIKKIYITIYRNIMENDKILIELIQKQRKNIIEKKLLYNDLKRISKYLTKSIFNNECSLWNGYITTIKNDDKSSYINFYYNGKKFALHRLLYQNFIGELNDSEYIKFNCCNKGKCCNINHFYKILKSDTDEIKNEPSKNTESVEKKEQKDIVVDFDI